MRTCFLIVLNALFLSGTPLSGQPASHSRQIREWYIGLDTLQGNRLLQERYTENDPESLRMIGYRDFLNALIYQSKVNADRFYRQSGEWLKILNQSGDDPACNLPAIAEIHLYRAVIASQFSDYKTSAVELIASYRVLSRWGTEFSTADRNKLSGILGMLFQQIPDSYRPYLKILGIRSSGLSGYNGLERYYTAAAPGTVERKEGYLLLITALKEFSPDPMAAWDFAVAEGMPMMENPLVRYQTALAALKAGHSERALEYLEDGLRLHGSAVFPFWDYQLGRLKVYRNDPDANIYLEKFLQKPGGDNYRHKALLLSGFFYLINKETVKAESCFTAVRNLPEPMTVYDRQALHEAEIDGLSDPEILKTRLWFDGGYYDQSLACCDSLISEGGYDDRVVGELFYRKGRCEQQTGRVSAAQESYKGVLARAAKIRSYILPNSALQLGYLYKKEGRDALALQYFNLCLDLNKYEYQEGIERQAQTAIREMKQ